VGQSKPFSVPQRLRLLNQEIVRTAPGILSAELQTFLFVADNEGVCQREVCEGLSLPQPTVSRYLKNLGHAGLQLIRCEGTGRERPLRLSHKGREFLGRMAIILGCLAGTAAAAPILCQFDIEPEIATPYPGYDVCRDPRTFQCDVS
jgi:DNA-binding MarR family transcriptional regulator